MKIWTKEEIVALIDSNDKMVARSVVQIYMRQTADEQMVHSTNHQNGIGFNGVDAPILSSFAECYQTRGYLSPKQTAIARKKIRKYAKQLTAIANNEL